MSYREFYSRMGLNEGATQSQIKSAYRKLALKYHPDHNPGDAEAEETFKKILEAYEILSGLEETPPAPKKRRRPVRKKATKSNEPKKTTATGKASNNVSSKQNLRYNVFITLEEVAFGTEKTVRYIRSKESEKENVQLRVKIPKGSRHHQRLKITDLGNITDGIAGDLFVVVHIQPHHIFDIEGLDLYTKVPVTYFDVVVGNEIKVPTLSGFGTIKLRPCRFVDIYGEIPGQGLPEQSGTERGKLAFEFYIVHPTRLSDEEKKALLDISNSWPTNDKVTQYYQQFLSEEK